MGFQFENLSFFQSTRRAKAWKQLNFIRHVFQKRKFWNVLNYFDDMLMHHLAQCVITSYVHQLLPLTPNKLASFEINIKLCCPTALQKWANPALFYRLFSVFSNKHHYNFYNKYLWKMSIQYMVLRFEPTTFGTWISSNNHHLTLVTVPPTNSPSYD